MNGVLSPSAVSSVANQVYQIRESNTFTGSFHNDFTKNFDLTTNQIKGVSGGLINQLFNIKSGFALTAQGITPQFKKHHIIGIRGSDSGADWLSNANIGVTNGPKNMAVHAGFQKIFRTLRPEFEQYINHHKPRCLHCVGHSLGGALAQLTAVWASERGIPVKLYTFGAPRSILTNSVPKAQTKISHHRMIHGADPVPKVPIWPFSHTTGEYQLGMSENSRIDFGAHSMTHSPGYMVSASAYADFGSMASRYNPMNTQRVVLRYEDRYQASFSQRWQRRISDALITLLKDTGQYALIAAQASLGIGLTFYDILARSLNAIAKASVAAYEQVTGILGHMLAFAGRKTQQIIEVTAKFIRWVFEVMIAALYKMAKAAVDSIS
tara:strand:- start:240 stop:1379 length:1140 start_codon:yes stop_codon:yes gene_type:complete